MEKCVVLLSGGIDSAVTLWWARAQGWRPATLSFLFPRRKKRELECVRKLRRALPGRGEDYDVPLAFLEPPDQSKNGFIPQRNLMYYSIAAAIAQQAGATRILGGHIRPDHSLFPDATPAYFRALQKLVGNGGSRVRLVFPLHRLEKPAIIRLGARLGVPFAATWSCSYDRARPCGRCYSCRERSDGFARAGLADPAGK